MVKAEKKQEIQKDIVLDIKNLTFRYRGSTRGSFQLKNINIQIEKGKWTTIIGANGSGKSTIAKCVARILHYKKGEILVFGKDIKKIKGKEFARKIAYIPQQIDIPEGTPVYDFVSFGRNPYTGFAGTLSKQDKHVIQDVMEATGTWQWKDKMVDELSGGQRQKVLIAMVMAQQAEIILLDEPTTYLDIRNQYELLELMDILHLQGKTVIAILHDINQAAQFSDKIYVLKDGVVIEEGTSKEVINNDMLKEAYEVSTNFYKNGDKKYITDVQLIGGLSLNQTSNIQHVSLPKNKHDKKKT